VQGAEKGTEEAAGRHRAFPCLRRRLLSLLTELFVFAGLAVAGYSAWNLWGTGLETAQTQHTLRQTLQQTWNQPPPASQHGDSPAAARSLGDALALIRIPALGADWEWVVLEGTSPETLAKGIGHQPGTARPGQPGNFVLAGHRATHGAPFAHLPDNVRIGDPIQVETADVIYTYRVTRTKHTTPNDIAVLAQPDDPPGHKPRQAVITLITCTPRWGSTGRWITYGQLADTTPKQHVQ
jgi:sortase A